MLREFLLGSAQIHILHHAAQEPVFGLALLRDLQQHGYELSPGTLYPLLHRLEGDGHLVRTDRIVQGKVRKYYAITDGGRRVLEEARPKIGELVHEVLDGHGPTSTAKPVERAETAEAPRASEQTIRALYDVASARHLSFDDKVQALLAMGCLRFGLPIGILAHITGEQYEVVQVHPPNGPIVRGQVFPLGQTYCRETLSADGPVGFEHAGGSSWKSHPCYTTFKLEAYLATPVLIEGDIYGTLSFSSPDPYRGTFTDTDKDTLRLMAQWLGGEIERRHAEEERAELLAREHAARVVAEETSIINARLVAAAIAAQQRLEVLQETTKRVGQSLDLELVFSAALEAARRLFAADRAAVCQIDDSDAWVCRASFGLSDAYVEALCPAVTATSIVGRAVATREPVKIEDVADAALPADVLSAITAEGFRAMLAVPLLRPHEFVGALSIYHDQPRHYTAEDMQAAQALGSQLEIAIDNARLYAAERRARAEAEAAREETAALLDATRQITSSLDLTTTLDHILDTVVRLCEADIATVALLDAHDMVLPHVSARGPQAHVVQRASFRVGEGLTGTTARTRQVRNIPDVESDPLRVYRVVPKSAAMRSLILIPLCQRETVVGVLCVWSKQVAHFGPQHERLLRGLADEAALAIVHAREEAERQEAEKALRESEERSRRLLENATDLVSVLAADGTILYESPAADRVLGPNSSQERLGKNAFAFLHPDDAGRVASMLADFVQRPGTIERSTFRFRHGDGSWRVLEAIGHNLLHDPLIHGIIINSRDITERVQINEGLRFLAQASAELASSLDYQTTLHRVAHLAVRALADACFVDILGEDRSIRSVAVAHQDAAKEDILRELRRCYPIDPRGHHPTALVIRTGVSQLTPEVSPEWLTSFAVDRGHLELIAELSVQSDMIVPLVVHGQTLGAISFISSRPDRRYGPADLAVAEGLANRAALAIDNARLYREAQEAVRLRNEFLGLVVHDLKNPLGAIKDYAQLVQLLVADLDSPRAPKISDLLGRVDAVVMKMVTQINELLDVAHLQMGQPLLLEQSPVDLHAIARQKVAEHQRERTRYRILMDSHLSELVGLWDGPRLERVLDNLLSNATKYSPAGSDVVVRLAQEESEARRWAVLEVRDSGIGIPAADLPHIFERFHRGSNVVGAIAGSGLGLTGVRQIVLQHRGTIAVASQEGRGTTVTVRLPLAPA